MSRLNKPFCSYLAYNIHHVPIATVQFVVLISYNYMVLNFFFKLNNTFLTLKCYVYNVHTYAVYMSLIICSRQANYTIPKRIVLHVDDLYIAATIAYNGI